LAAGLVSALAFSGAFASGLAGALATGLAAGFAAVLVAGLAGIAVLEDGIRNLRSSSNQGESRRGLKAW
jgi:hypothetical protein